MNTPQQQAASSSVAATLGHDHQRLDRLLDDVARSVGDGELERAGHTFTEFANGLRRHIRLEEDLLFPLFEERTGIRRGPTGMMHEEHRVIVALLDRIEASLDHQDASAFHAARQRLDQVLALHNAKEERVLYPMIDRALQPGERMVLVERLQRA